MCGTILFEHRQNARKIASHRIRAFIKRCAFLSLWWRTPWMIDKMILEIPRKSDQIHLKRKRDDRRKYGLNSNGEEIFKWVPPISWVEIYLNDRSLAIDALENYCIEIIILSKTGKWWQTDYYYFYFTCSAAFPQQLQLWRRRGGCRCILHWTLILFLLSF